MKKHAVAKARKSFRGLLPFDTDSSMEKASFGCSFAHLSNLCEFLMVTLCNGLNHVPQKLRQS